MKMKLLEDVDRDFLSSFLKKSPFLPYRYLLSKKENVIDFSIKDILERLKDGASFLVFSDEKDLIKGFCLFEDLKWDSQIFNKKMGSINYLLFGNEIEFLESCEIVSKIVSYAQEKSYDFLLCKTYTDNLKVIHALEKNGFLLVDTLLDFIWDSKKRLINNEFKTDEYIIVEEASPSDEEALKKIAYKAFSKHFGRYHSDPFIPKELANRVYQEWISSSFKGYADYIFIARVNGEIAGYSIWKKSSKLEKECSLSIGHYSIAGVDEAFRGKGIFKILTMAGMRALMTEVELIEGPTHINNYPVQKGYVSLGWYIGDARHSFHKWL